MQCINTFSIIDHEMLRQEVINLKPSTCALDPIPTSFIKTVFDCLAEEVLAIVNHSLFTVVFPSSLKTAMVESLLKKSNLDPLIPKNLKPDLFK